MGFRVEGDAGNLRLPHAAFERGPAGWAFFVLEWPDDAGPGSRCCKPEAIERPGKRVRFRWIAGHAHVLLIFDAPGMQSLLLHCRDQKPAIRRDRNGKMGALPFEPVR